MCFVVGVSLRYLFYLFQNVMSSSAVSSFQYYSEYLD